MDKCSHWGGLSWGRQPCRPRYLAEVGRSLAASSRLSGRPTQSFLQTFQGTLPITLSHVSPPWRSEGRRLGPPSASTLRLWIEKSRRLKHDLQREKKKNQYFMRG